MFTKDIFSKLHGKKVLIKMISFGTAVKSTYEGILIGWSYGGGTELFLELDTGEYVYVKYMESIKEL